MNSSVWLTSSGIAPLGDVKNFLCDNRPPADPHYLNLLNHSWPSDRLVVSLSSGQGYFTFLYGHTKHNIHNQEVEEKRKSKHGLGLALSARRKKFMTLSEHSVSYRERVFERNSHKVTRNADSSSHVGQPGLWVRTY